MKNPKLPKLIKSTGFQADLKEGRRWISFSEPTYKAARAHCGIDSPGVYPWVIRRCKDGFIRYANLAARDEWGIPCPVRETA